MTTLNESVTNNNRVPNGNESPNEVDLDVLRCVPERFTVTDTNSANWVVRKIIEARSYSARVKIWAEQEQRRALSEERTLLFLFGRQLEHWTLTEIEKLASRRKSISLPAGTVGFRKVGPRLVIDNEASVLSWAKANCQQAVVTVQKLSKVSLNAYVEASGHIPDQGAHMEMSIEHFFIK
jgi:hypothetical protein